MRVPRMPYLLVAGIFFSSASGCGNSDEKKTILGLQEENRVRSERIASLTKDVEALRTENRELKSALTKDFEDRLAKIQLLQRQEVGRLEGELASLRLERNSVQREKLALQEVLEQKPRVEEANRVRFGVERMVWGLLLVVVLAVLLIITSRYLALRNRLGQFVVRQASEFRRLGVTR